MRTASRTLSHSWYGAMPAKQWAGAVNPLPADMEIGTTTVTFSGVNANSEIRIYSPSGVELAGIENCTADQVLTWNVYSPAYNTVRIVIVHPSYRIKEFTYTSQAGNQSIPVQQEPDKWYSNP